ncbi:uncharacterized protein LOC142977191 isoform X2 [Anticarsia gemmatalis]
MRSSYAHSKPWLRNFHGAVQEDERYFCEVIVRKIVALLKKDKTFMDILCGSDEPTSKPPNTKPTNQPTRPTTTEEPSTEETTSVKPITTSTSRPTTEPPVTGAPDIDCPPTPQSKKCFKKFKQCRRTGSCDDDIPCINACRLAYFHCADPEWNAKDWDI